MQVCNELQMKILEFCFEEAGTSENFGIKEYYGVTILST